MSPSSLNAPLSRRGFLTLTGIAALGVTLASCSGGEGGGGSRPAARTAQTLVLPTYVAPQQPAGGIVSTVQGMPTIYTTPIEEYFDSVAKAPLAGGEVSTFQVLWGAPPQAVPANKYWADLNRRLGGEYAPTLVAFDTYNEKLATTIASGEVPDLVFVQDTVAVGAKAINDGVFADLSDTLAGDGILRWPNLAAVGSGTWTASAKNGHIFGVPNENPFITNFPALRWDLMSAAGFAELPHDAAGFLEMMTAVAALKQVNGKQHWGIAAFDANVEAVVEWMHRAGTQWQRDGSGKLVHLIETDTYAEVLEYHTKLWKAGVYHPDAIALGTQPNTANEMWENGQSAMTMNSFNGFFGANILRNTVDNTPGADPRLFVPPAVDGGDIVIQRDDGYWGMVSISAKAAKDPARLEELLGVLDYWRSPDGSSEALFIHSGLEGYNFEFGPERQTVDLKDDTANADRAGLQWLGVFKSPSYVVSTSSLDFVDNFRESVEALTAATIPNPVVGLYNEPNVTNSAKLAAINTDYRGGIVSGRMQLSQLEEYRDTWRKAGGEQVRAAYETALAETK